MQRKLRRKPPVFHQLEGCREGETRVLYDLMSAEEGGRHTTQLLLQLETKLEWASLGHEKLLVVEQHQLVEEQNE